MSAGIKSEYADILNALSEMQQAAYYAVRRADLRKAEDTILWLDRDTQALREENRRLREAVDILRKATYQSHNGHWDMTGGSGSGCPECMRAREARAEADEWLNSKQPAKPTRDGGEG